MELMLENIELIKTEDGSHTLVLPGIGEHYHSRFGAITESREVYIEPALLPAMQLKKNVNVLEVGFGTGLNALLTADMAIRHQATVHYLALEPYPVHPEWISQLNYPLFFDQVDFKNYFFSMHEQFNTAAKRIHGNFYLTRSTLSVSRFTSSQLFDVIYFDAFAPVSQPDLWTPEIFAKMYNLMSPGGIMTTYCSKTVVRKNMQKAGFQVQKLPGPPHKREILRAWKSNL